MRGRRPDPGPLSLTGLLALWLLPVGSLVAQNLPDRQTRNVILITVDGLRTQELFSGVDPLLLGDAEGSGIANLDEVLSRYWRSSPAERREALLPFFWGEFAPQAVVLGDRSRESRVAVGNPHRVSYPGYAEILTGQVQSTITGNDPVRIGRETVLEFVRRSLDLRSTDVATFASWSVFWYITASQEGRVFTNAGFQELPAFIDDPGSRLVSDLQMRVLTPWASVRPDAVTFELALRYLREYKPRVLYLALGETDDWAHDRRYDQVLSAAQLFDHCLSRLWSELETIDEYRGKTSIIITSDHGRGRTRSDWNSHGANVEGADETWIVVAGPNTPDRGVVAGPHDYTLANVAATLLRLMHLVPGDFNPDGATSIAEAISD